MGLNLPRFDGHGVSGVKRLRERRDARLAALWRREDAFETAVPRVLGISAERLAADWRRDTFRLGPDPREGVAPGTVAVTLGWGALVLLWGVRTARRREVE